MEHRAVYGAKAMDAATAAAASSLAESAAAAETGAHPPAKDAFTPQQMRKRGCVSVADENRNQNMTLIVLRNLSLRELQDVVFSERFTGPATTHDT